MTILLLNSDIDALIAGLRVEHEKLARLTYHFTINPTHDREQRQCMVEAVAGLERQIQAAVMIRARLDDTNQQLLAVSGSLVGILAAKPVKIHDSKAAE